MERATHRNSSRKNSCLEELSKTFFTSWSSRPNPENQINRKPDDRKNDQTTEKAKKHKTESIVLNLTFGPIHI